MPARRKVRIATSRCARTNDLGKSSLDSARDDNKLSVTSSEVEKRLHTTSHAGVRRGVIVWFDRPRSTKFDQLDERQDKVAGGLSQPFRVTFALPKNQGK
jgi:hypothetical protein